MKKISKLSYLLLLGLVALVFGSCNNDFDYEAAGNPGKQIYFSNKQDTTINIDKNGTSFNVVLHRVNTADELTVNLVYTPEQAPGIFTLATPTVTFAAGAATANVTFTYDPANTEYGVYTGGTLAVADTDNDATYGIASLKFKAGPTEWETMKTAKGEDAIAKFRDDAITTVFGFSSTPIWNCKIQKSVVTEGRYRLLDPYKDWYEQQHEVDPEDKEFKYDDSEEHGLVINATDPDYVYVEECRTGLSYTEDGKDLGKFTLLGVVYYNLKNGASLDLIKAKKPEWFGQLKNGVISFPGELAIAICLDGVQNGNPLGGNANGACAIALPGHPIVDYTLDATYTGRFTDTDGNDHASFKVTFGDDVASIKYVLKPSSEATATVIAGIVDGSIEATEMTASGTAQAAFTETGNYNFIAVIYNADGEVVGNKVVAAKLKSSKDADEKFEDIAGGIFTVGKKNLSSTFFQQPWTDPLPFGDNEEHEATLSQGQTDKTKFRISPYLKDDYLEFTVGEDGNIILEPQQTGAQVQISQTEVTDLYVSDFYSFELKDDPKFAALLNKKGYRSSYSSEKNNYLFINIFLREKEGSLQVLLPICQIDTYQVSDESNAAIRRAFSVAQKEAKAKKYITLPKTNTEFKSFFAPAKANHAKRSHVKNANSVNVSLR